MIQSAKAKLLEVFGYHDFRKGQEEIVRSVLSSNDNLVIMPTGGGKSLCYQLPAILLPHLTLVVSPLIALMEDQVAALLQLGIKAAAIHSNIDASEKRSIFENIENEQLKLLYAAPETLLQESFLKYLSSKKVSFIAIDEAHCVSVWGNDFRPEYTSLYKLKEHFKGVPFIALTATADPATQTEMLEKLGLSDPKVSISSFERDNIMISSASGIQRIEQIRKFVSKYKGESGIIYCLSRNSTEKLAQKMEQFGFRAAYYHAGMDAMSRSRIQTRFQNDEIDIICATIAFGMGIDKSNVRYVIHYNLPKNVESYYQEIGRSGRDGLKAEALLFYSWADVLQLRNFIENSEASSDFKEVQMAKLDRMWELATGYICRTNFILNYFGEYRREACGHCDNCLNPPQSFDGTTIAQKALSAVARCEQKATLTQIIDVLKGAYRDDIKDLGFHEIKTFGAGRDMSYPEWREYLTQIINVGLLSVDYSNGSRLLLTPLSEDVLKAKAEVPLYRIQKKEVKAPKTTKTVQVEDELFELLRKWRSTEARKQKIPAYTILHDRTLKELSSEKPTVIHEIDMIDGIGSVKKEKYGEQLIEIIRNYLLNQEHHKNFKGKTHLATLELLNTGMSVQAISSERELNEITIYSHIAALYLQGHEVQIEKYFTAAEKDQVQKAWLELNKPSGLKEIYERLEGSVTYATIRLVVSYLQKNKITE